MAWKQTNTARFFIVFSEISTVLWKVSVAFLIPRDMRINWSRP